MQPTTLISPDFARRCWINSEGEARESPVARRATEPYAHHRDDFELQAENPRLVAELIVGLERYADTDPVVVIARGERGRPDRVQVEHAGHTILLHPADARLAAMALEADPPFEGAWGVASRLREAALRIDYGRPPVTGRMAEGESGPSTSPQRDDDDPLVLRASGWTLLALGALLAFVAVMAVWPILPGRI